MAPPSIVIGLLRFTWFLFGVLQEEWLRQMRTEDVLWTQLDISIVQINFSFSMHMNLVLSFNLR